MNFLHKILFLPNHQNLIQKSMEGVNSQSKTAVKSALSRRGSLEDNIPRDNHNTVRKCFLIFKQRPATFFANQFHQCVVLASNNQLFEAFQSRAAKVNTKKIRTCSLRIIPLPIKSIALKGTYFGDFAVFWSKLLKGFDKEPFSNTKLLWEHHKEDVGGFLWERTNYNEVLATFLQYTGLKNLQSFSIQAICGQA